MTLPRLHQIVEEIQRHKGMCCIAETDYLFTTEKRSYPPCHGRIVRLNVSAGTVKVIIAATVEQQNKTTNLRIYYFHEHQHVKHCLHDFPPLEVTKQYEKIWSASNAFQDYCSLSLNSPWRMYKASTNSEYILQHILIANVFMTEGIRRPCMRSRV